PAPGGGGNQPQVYTFGGNGPTPGGTPAWGAPGGGMGGPGGGFGGPGGGGMGGPRPSDPERSWAVLQRLTNSTGDSIDLSKIPVESRGFLKQRAESSGGIPLPEGGVMSKSEFLAFHAKSEAAKASFAANGGGTSPTMMTMSPDMMGMGRGRGMGGPGGMGGM